MSGAARSSLGSGGEFDRIRRILGRGTGYTRGVSIGPGDDAAVLEGGTVLSTDLSIEGVHFRLDWISPAEAGYRAAAAGVSDLAAMAAEPLGVLASVGAPGGGEGAEELMSGVTEFLDEFGIPLLGGDLTHSPDRHLLDIVSVGRASHPLLRSGAAEGDELWVTGVLGGPAGAVALWEAGGTPSGDLRAAFLRPRPRLREARFLVEAGARAGLDLSDGIGGDAGHLAAASGVAAVLDPRALPLHPALSDGELPEKVDPRSLALSGGEDYELLVSAPPGVLGPRVEEFRQRFDLSLTRVGQLIRGEGVFLSGSHPGELVPIGRRGYDHFSDEIQGR